MLNLDVSVRLLDGLTKPAKEAGKSLDRFGAATARLATRARRLSGDVKGLAGAFRSLRAVDGALDRSTASTGRLRGSMAGLGDTARRQAPGITLLGRATDRLAANATRATAEMRALRRLASSPLDGSGFIGAANREMRDMLGMQRQAIANMRRLNAGGGGGSGRRGSSGTGSGGRGGSGGHGTIDGVMGHAFFGATSGIVLGGEAIRELYSQGADRVDEYTKMAMAGVDAEQIARNRAAAIATARTIGGSGINANLATLRHLRFALGSDEEATRSLTPVAQATQVMKTMNPNLDAEDNAFAMAKAAEMKGVSQDPDKFRRYMGLMANTAIATGGKTTGRDFQMFAAMSKGTSTFLTADAFAGLVSSIGGELGAGRTGNALAMSTRAAIGGVMTKRGREQLEKLGLWDERSKSLKNGDSFQADPHRWVEDNLVPVLKAEGLLKMDHDGNVDPEKAKEVGRLFAKMFSNSNVANFFTLLTTQGRRYEKDQALRNKVALDNFALQMKSPTYAMGTMTQAFKDMLGTMSEADMPEIISGLNGLTKAFNGIAGMDPNSLGLLTELGGAFLALGPSIWAARLAYMTFIKPLRELPAIIRTIAASEWVANTATIAWNGSALILQTTLGRLLATMTALTGGFEVGSWLGKWADKHDAANEDKGMSDRAKQAETMGRQRDLAKQNQRWNDPRLGWWDHFKTGQAAEDDRRWLDARGAPYEGTPIAGARATGGPVGAGKTYIVGEHGPELFTPGAHGGITSNTMLGQMAERAANDNKGSEAISQEIRFMSYTLSERIEDLNRTMGRMQFGHGEGGSTGSDGTGGGTPGGRGGGSTGPAGGRHGADDGSTPDSDTRSTLAKAGITDRAVESGQDAFNLYGAKKRGEGVRPITPGGGMLGFGLSGPVMPGNPAQGGGVGSSRHGRRSSGQAQGALDLSGDTLARTVALVKRYEGFAPRAKWDVNHYRLGYGSDTKTDESGNPHEVHRGDTTTRAEADRDLVRRIPIFQKRLAQQVGFDHWNKLSPNAKAALTSIGYNYGSFAKLRTLRSAIATDDPRQIAEAVKGLQGQNGGINRKRRLSEASIIENGGAAGTGGQVPALVAERARRTGIEHRHRQERLAAGGGERAGNTIHNHNTFNVHGGDPRQVADAVHAKFVSAVRMHLSDGVFA